MIGDNGLESYRWFATYDIATSNTNTVPSSTTNYTITVLDASA